MNIMINHLFSREEYEYRDLIYRAAMALYAAGGNIVTRPANPLTTLEDRPSPLTKTRK